MRERNLIDAIHRRLPKQLHRQSMTNASAAFNGTPDYYYDGPCSDLWIEYKQLASVPRNGTLEVPTTALQRRWLERRSAHGRNAFVVVGLPNKTALLLSPEQHAYDMADFSALRSYKEVAEWICAFCGRY